MVSKLEIQDIASQLHCLYISVMYACISAATRCHMFESLDLHCNRSWRKKTENAILMRADDLRPDTAGAIQIRSTTESGLTTTLIRSKQCFN